MKYKVGDRVRIKNLDWYNRHTNETEIDCGGVPFTSDMKWFCSCVMTISYVHADCYTMVEDLEHYYSDEMIEGLVEKEFGTASNPIEIKSNANCLTLERVGALAVKTDEELSSGNPYEWECPDGYIFKDENGNVINATKIVLEKKHNDKLKLESTKKVREYWSEYTRIFIEIYDDEPNECVLTHLYTLECHRQEGYGKQALSEAESIAKELGCHTAYLKVETNSWMHNWYLRCGYNWNKNADEGYTWLTKKL